MTKKYDAVIVGAGNSGISAGIQLCLNGYKPLIVEQHNLPGGCATSFVRGRFEIEPSLHELCDVGPVSNPGETRSLFDSYGVKIDWVEAPECFRVITTYSDGSPMDVTMPHGIEAFIDKMEEYVPGSRPQMENLFKLFQEVLDGIGYISASAGNPDSNVLKKEYPNFLRTGAYPTKRVFEALKLPERCQDILSTYWAYLGTDMERLGFVHYAAMVHKYVSRGAYIPTHTSHELSSALIARYRELGGEIWYNCRAEKFLFEGDKLCAVKTTAGTVECNYCLPNINPDIVYGKMMPKELVPQRQIKLSNARKQMYGGRMETAYFCLDVPYEELGIENYSIFFMGTADSAQEYKDMSEGGDKNQYVIFLCYNVANPKASEEGTCIVSFTSFASPKEWNHISQKDYFKHKDEIAKGWVEFLNEKTGIDIEGHIEEMEIASPMTFSRYLSVPEGSVYGHETQDWDSMMARLTSLSKDYTVKGLRPIGAGGPRGDGYSMTYTTGNMMANLATKDMKMWEAQKNAANNADKANNANNSQDASADKNAETSTDKSVDKAPTEHDQKGGE